MKVGTREIQTSHLIIGVGCLLVVNGAIVASSGLMPYSDVAEERETSTVSDSALQLYTIGKYSQAIEMFEEGSKPFTEEEFEGYILSLLKVGAYQQAYDLFLEDSTRTPLLRIFSKALVLNSMQEYDGLEQYLAQQVHEDAVVTSLFLQLRAEALDSQGQRSAFKTLAYESWSLDPLSPSSNLLKGVAQKYEGLRNASYDMLEKAIELGLAESDLYHFNKGIVAYYVANYEEAVEHLLQVTSSDSFDYQRYVFLGRSTLELGKMSQSMEYLQTAVSLDDSKSDAYLWLGIASERSKKYEIAARYYQDGLEQNTHDVQLLLALLKVSALTEEVNTQDILQDIDEIISTESKHYEVLIEALLEMKELDRAREYVAQYDTFAGDEQKVMAFKSRVAAAQLLENQDIDKEFWVSLLDISEDAHGYVILALDRMKARSVVEAQQLLWEYDDSLELTDLYILTALYYIKSDQLIEALGFLSVQGQQIEEGIRTSILLKVLDGLSQKETNDATLITDMMEKLLSSAGREDVGGIDELFGQELKPRLLMFGGLY